VKLKSNCRRFSNYENSVNLSWWKSDRIPLTNRLSIAQGLAVSNRVLFVNCTQEEVYTHSSYHTASWRTMRREWIETGHKNSWDTCRPAASVSLGKSARSVAVNQPIEINITYIQIINFNATDLSGVYSQGQWRRYTRARQVKWQMTLLEDPPTWLKRWLRSALSCVLLCFGNSVNRKSISNRFICFIWTVRGLRDLGHQFCQKVFSHWFLSCQVCTCCG